VTIPFTLGIHGVYYRAELSMGTSLWELVDYFGLLPMMFLSWSMVFPGLLVLLFMGLGRLGKEPSTPAKVAWGIALNLLVLGLFEACVLGFGALELVPNTLAIPLYYLPDLSRYRDSTRLPTEDQVEIRAKYSGYIERQAAEIERHRRHEETSLPADLDYARVRGLSAEVCEKLSHQRPDSLGQAARIPGVTPAAISLLLVHLKKRSAA